MLPAERRLRRVGEVRAVHRGGRTVAGRYVVVRYRANGLPVSRFAFAVPRKVGRAVARNRWRRRLREIIRRRLEFIRPGYDVVVTVIGGARAGGTPTRSGELAAEVERLLSRAGLLG